ARAPEVRQPAFQTGLEAHAPAMPLDAEGDVAILGDHGRAAATAGLETGQQAGGLRRTLEQAWPGPQPGIDPRAGERASGVRLDTPQQQRGAGQQGVAGKMTGAEGPRDGRSHARGCHGGVAGPLREARPGAPWRANRATQDCVLGRIRRREWSPWWHTLPACRGRQSRRDNPGMPGAPTRPGVRSPPRSAYLVVGASFAAPASLAAAWRSHVPPYDSCSGFLSDPRRSLGSVYTSFARSWSSVWRRRTRRKEPSSSRSTSAACG